jgi:hypothetical protein
VHSNDIAKLNKIIKASKINFPKVKINFAILDSGEVASCINGYCLTFENVRKFVRELAFLNEAKFTQPALKACGKKKNKKKKNIFFYWLFTCVSMARNKGKTLEELRQEYYKIYGLELKQGRKKRLKEETATQGLTECT